MPFPKHNIIPEGENNKLFSEIEIKKIGFSPIAICSFFEGIQVLQVQSNKNKETLFGLYFNNILVGHVYDGKRYKEEEVLEIKTKYFPKKWSNIEEYSNTIEGIWYCKFPIDQYAWIYQRVLTKIK